ncbi:MAG: GMP synthase [Thermodesulfobacteriota bacterium]|nr:MAG: GMP synthase [Thermodesulfobacteriota bacterium]
MKKKILIIQHVESEGPGIIGTAIAAAGFDMEYVRLYLGERVPQRADGFSAVIAMGGPMGVYEEKKHPFIKYELRLMEDAFKADLPVMGICLGAQMLARAAGAPVYKGRIKEIGFYKVRLTGHGVSDPLLTGLPPEFTVFQWHGDTFDIPPNSVNLASSDAFPHQLIRVGRRSYGFQFHFEVTLDMVKEFLQVNSEELAGVRDAASPEMILRDAEVHLATIQGYGSTIVKRFLRGLG